MENRPVQQPKGIEIPDRDNPITWAIMPRVYIEWARQVAPQLNIDTKKLVSGFLIDTILTDDLGVFGGAYYPDLAWGHQQQLLKRLDVEIETPETPQDLIENLKSAQAKIKELDWTKEKDFKEAERIWTEMVNTPAQKHINLAEEYRLNSVTLSPYWKAFLYKGAL